MFSSNGMNPFGQDNTNNREVSPEPLFSSKNSEEKNNSLFKDKLFANKIFKTMNNKKKEKFPNQNRRDDSFMNPEKRSKSKMMQSIAEQNEKTLNKIKFNSNSNRGFIFGGNPLAKLTKRNPNLNSTAIAININDKKKHAFNSTYKIQSKCIPFLFSQRVY